MEVYNDLESVVVLRQRLENKLSGRFILYKSNESNLDSQVTIKQRDTDHVNGIIAPRVLGYTDINSKIDIKYRGNDYLHSYIEAIASEFLECSLYVRPHNRLSGKFELLEAPKIEVELSPLADASTRNGFGQETINYGDTRSMLTGQNDIEKFESFISFGDLKTRIPDLQILESAKLRLHYINFRNGSNLELHQPNTLWRELGVTYANQPYSVELLSDQYSVNAQERYIEFDLLEVAKRWQSNDLLNYGFIIRTSENETLSFFTRESNKSPLLIVKYITSQIYSLGRSEIDSTVFINGRGIKDITGHLTVHSDVGLEWLESSIYVHRLEVPVSTNIDSYLGTTRADINSELIVARRTSSDADSQITVATNRINDNESSIISSSPDLWSYLVIDPNATLKSIIAVARTDISDPSANILVSQQDICGSVSTSNRKKTSFELNSEITVNVYDTNDISSNVTISRQDFSGFITIRVQDDTNLESRIETPYYESKISTLYTSFPEISSNILIKYQNQIDAQFGVKEKTLLDSTIDVKNITEIIGLVQAKQISETEAHIQTSFPDLHAVLHVRAIDLNDLNGLASIRKRDVSDMNSIILIKGTSNGAYYFIL